MSPSRSKSAGAAPWVTRGVRSGVAATAATSKKPLSDPDPAVRSECTQSMIDALHKCKLYGGTTVLLVPAVVNENVRYDEAWERSTAEIKKMLPEAEKTGVKIAIEKAGLRPEDIDLIVREGSRFGIVIPLEDGTFKVSRFSLVGSTYAIDLMRAAAEQRMGNQKKTTKAPAEEYL